MFLIGAFIIAASLIVLKLNMKAPSIEEQLRLLDITMENSIANNLMSELENSAKFSVNERSNISLNVFDFANFTERKAAERRLEFKFFFVGSYANVSNNYLNISVINMLNQPIDVSLDLNDGSSPQTNNNMVDNTKWDTNFTFNPGTEYNLTVSYNSIYTQNITIKTKNNKDIYVGFFDFTLQTSESIYTKKTEETYRLK